MKIFNLFFALLIITGLSILIHSCAKENSTEAEKSQEIKVQTRGDVGDCTPDDVYPIFINCTVDTTTKIIDFSAGLTLYSNGSLLYQLCPGVQFEVTYFFSTCNYNSPTEIHFIYNLNYNLADIIAACPALQVKIDQQTIFGNLVGFLDELDADISKQIEFSEVYKAALELANKGKYLCDGGPEFYNVKYIQNSCFQWVPYTEPTPVPIPAYKKVACDSSICCIRIGQYCIDGFYEGQPVINGSGNSTYESTQGTCPLSCTHECGQTTSPGSGTAF